MATKRRRRRSDWPLLLAILASITLLGIIHTANQRPTISQHVPVLSIPAYVP